MNTPTLQHIEINWASSNLFKLNAYRMPNNGFTYIVIHPTDKENFSHNILSDFEFQQTQQNNYLHNLGEDPTNLKVKAFIDELINKNYEDVQASKVKYSIAFMIDDINIVSQRINESQFSDALSENNVISNAPFIVLASPNDGSMAIGGIVTDKTIEELSAIDPNCFAHEGGVFVHAQHIKRSENFISVAHTKGFALDSSSRRAELENALNSNKAITHGGIVYLPYTAEKIETHFQQNNFETYLNAQGKADVDFLLTKLLHNSGFKLKDPAVGYDGDDEEQYRARMQHLLQASGSENAHTNKSFGGFASSEVELNSYQAETVDQFSTTAEESGHILVSSISSNESSTSANFISDTQAAEIIRQARENKNLEPDSNAFQPTGYATINVENNLKHSIELANQNLISLRFRNQKNNENQIVNPRFIHILQGLIASEGFKRNLKATEIAEFLSAHDVEVSLRLIQNELQFNKQKNVDDALQDNTKILGILTKLSNDEANSSPQIQQFVDELFANRKVANTNNLALSFNDIEPTSVDEIAKRMLKSPFKSERLASQQYFIELNEILKSDEDKKYVEARLEAFHDYFSDYSPLKQGAKIQREDGTWHQEIMPTESMIENTFAYLPYSQSGKFLEKIIKFESQYADELAQSKNAWLAQYGAEVMNYGEPNRDSIGSEAYMAYHGINLGTYVTGAGKQYSGYYILSDDPDFYDFIKHIDNERKRLRSAGVAAPNSVFHNIGANNWGENAIYASALFIRADMPDGESQELLKEIPSTIIRRHRVLMEKYQNNSNRNYNHIAPHKYVTARGKEIEGYIINLSKTKVRKAVPRALYDNNKLNRAGYEGKGMFIPTNLMWMLDNYMLKDSFQRSRDSQISRQQTMNFDNKAEIQGNETQRRELDVRRALLDIRASALWLDGVEKKDGLSPAFAQAIINTLHRLDNNQIGTIEQRLGVINYFSDHQIVSKLEALQADMPFSLEDCNDKVELQTQKMSNIDFLEHLSTHVVERSTLSAKADFFGSDDFKLSDNPVTKSNQLEAIKINLNAHLISVQLEGKKRENVTPTTLKNYENAILQSFEKLQNGDVGTHIQLLKQIGVKPSTVLFELSVEGSNSTEDLITRLTTQADLLEPLTTNISPASRIDDLAALEYAQQFSEEIEVSQTDIYKIKEEYDKALQALQDFRTTIESGDESIDEALQSTQKQIEAKFEEAAKAYVVGMIGLNERFDNHYGVLINKEQNLEELKEEETRVYKDVQALLDGFSADNNEYFFDLSNRFEEEPQRDTIEEFANFHKFTEGVYIKRDKSEIQGYYFDIHDKTFTQAVSSQEQSNPFARKIFPRVNLGNTDLPTNRDRAFVRKEELAIIPTGIYRENSRLYSITQEKIKLKALEGTQDNPITLDEKLFDTEPSRADNPAAIFDHYGIRLSQYKTHSGEPIAGRYIEINDVEFKQSVNILGSENNRIFGKQLFPNPRKDESVPESQAANVSFIREEALHKVPIELIREHHRLQTLRAVNQDREINLPAFDYETKNKQIIKTFAVPFHSAEDILSYMPKSMNELNGEQSTDHNKTSYMVITGKLYPIPLVREEAIALLPDSMVSPTELSQEFYESQRDNAKGSRKRMEVLVAAYNFYAEQNNKQLLELEDEIVLSKAHHDFIKNEEKAKKQNEIKEAEADAKAKEQFDDKNEALQSMWAGLAQITQNNEQITLDSVIADLAESGNEQDTRLADIVSSALERWEESGKDVADFEEYFSTANRTKERLEIAYEMGLFGDNLDALENLVSTIYNEEGITDIILEAQAAKGHTTEANPEHEWISAEEASVEFDRELFDRVLAVMAEERGPDNEELLDYTYVALKNWEESGRDINQLINYFQSEYNYPREIIGYISGIRQELTKSPEVLEQVILKPETTNEILNDGALLEEESSPPSSSEDIVSASATPSAKNDINKVENGINTGNENWDQKLRQLLDGNALEVQAANLFLATHNNLHGRILENFHAAFEQSEFAANVMVLTAIHNTHFGGDFYASLKDNNELATNDKAERLYELYVNNLPTYEAVFSEASGPTFEELLLNSLNKIKNNTSEVQYVSAAEALSIAQLAYSKTIAGDGDNNTIRQELFDNFDGWQMVYEVANKDRDSLLHAIIEHREITKVDNLNQAEIYVDDLLKRDLTDPIKPQIQSVIVNTLENIGYSHESVIDLSGGSTGLMSTLPEQDGGLRDLLSKDSIEGLVWKARDLNLNVIGEELAQGFNLESEKYKTVILKLSESKGLKSDHQSNTSYSSESAWQLKQLEAIQNGGLAILVAPAKWSETDNFTSSAQLQALNSLAKNFNLVAAARLPNYVFERNNSAHDDYELIVLQKSPLSAYQKLEDAANEGKNTAAIKGLLAGMQVREQEKRRVNSVIAGLMFGSDIQARVKSFDRGQKLADNFGDVAYYANVLEQALQKQFSKHYDANLQPILTQATKSLLNDAEHERVSKNDAKTLLGDVLDYNYVVAQTGMLLQNKETKALYTVIADKENTPESENSVLLKRLDINLAPELVDKYLATRDAIVNTLNAQSPTEFGVFREKVNQALVGLQAQLQLDELHIGALQGLAHDSYSSLVVNAKNLPTDFIENNKQLDIRLALGSVLDDSGQISKQKLDNIKTLLPPEAVKEIHSMHSKPLIINGLPDTENGPQFQLGDTTIDKSSVEEWLTKHYSNDAVAIRWGAKGRNIQNKWHITEGSFANFMSEHDFAITKDAKQKIMETVINNERFNPDVLLKNTGLKPQAFEQIAAEIKLVQKKYISDSINDLTINHKRLIEQRTQLQNYMILKGDNALISGGIALSDKQLLQAVDKAALISKTSTNKPVMLIVPNEKLTDYTAQVKFNNPSLNVLPIKAMMKQDDTGLDLERARIAQSPADILIVASSNFKGNLRHANQQSLFSPTVQTLVAQKDGELNTLKGIVEANFDGLPKLNTINLINRKQSEIDAIKGNNTLVHNPLESVTASILVFDQAIAKQNGQNIFWDNVATYAKANGAKIGMVGDLELLNDKHFNFELAKINHPAMLDKLNIITANDYMTRALERDVFVPSNRHSYALVQSKDANVEVKALITEQARTGELSDNLKTLLYPSQVSATLANPLYKRSLADEVSPRLEYIASDILENQQKSLSVIFYDSALFEQNMRPLVDQHIQETMQHYLGDAGIEIVSNQGLNSLMRRIEQGQTQVIIANSEDVYNGLSLQGRIGSIYTPVMPSLDRFDQYTIDVSRLDNEAGSHIVIEKDGFDFAKRTILQYTAGEGHLPSDTALLNNEKAVELVNGLAATTHVITKMEDAKYINDKLDRYAHAIEYDHKENASLEQFRTIVDDIALKQEGFRENKDSSAHLMFLNNVLTVMDTRHDSDVSPFKFFDLPVAYASIDDIIDLRREQGLPNIPVAELGEYRSAEITKDIVNTRITQDTIGEAIKVVQNRSRDHAHQYENTKSGLEINTINHKRFAKLAENEQVQEQEVGFKNRVYFAEAFNHTTANVAFDELARVQNIYDNSKDSIKEALIEMYVTNNALGNNDEIIQAATKLAAIKANEVYIHKDTPPSEENRAHEPEKDNQPKQQSPKGYITLESDMESDDVKPGSRMRQ